MNILLQQGMNTSVIIAGGVNDDKSLSPLRDDALFTKRPLNCLSCGSCDTKLKSVSPVPTGNFAQWKKLPARDPLDRLPKSG